MATKVQLSSLPAELRFKIWGFALLPSPGVYRFDRHKFVYIRAGFGNRREVEDERWLIPKRRYSTVLHLCRESRLFALSVKEKEEKGNVFFYCVGQNTRPFIPEIDTLWFDDDDRDGATLLDSAVVRECGVIGSKIHVIQNLALSAALIQSCPRWSGSVSNWDSSLFQVIGRFQDLRRVSVVFGPVPMETRCDDHKTDKDYWAAAGQEQTLDQYRDRVVFTGIYDVPELRLVEEIRGSDFETIGSSTDEDQDRDAKVVGEKMDKVRADVHRSYKKRVQYQEASCLPPSPQEEENATTTALGQGQNQKQECVAEVFYREKYLSEITFHATRIVETARFRGRPISKSFPSWYFSQREGDIGFETPNTLPAVPKRGMRYFAELRDSN